MRNADLAAFLHTVDICVGDVFFSSDQGDYLNLKYKLPQYLFSVAAGDQALLRNSKITCENDQDYILLQPYLIREKEN